MAIGRAIAANEPLYRDGQQRHPRGQNGDDDQARCFLAAGFSASVVQEAGLTAYREGRQYEQPSPVRGEQLDAQAKMQATATTTPAAPAVRAVHPVLS